MEWKGRRQSDNVEDVRGSSRQGGFGRSPFGRGGISFPSSGGGGRRGGIGSIVVLVIIFFVLKAMGIDVLQLLNQGGGTVGGSGYEQSTSPSGSTADSQTKAFVATVLADTEDTWTKILGDNGETYVAPKLVLFSGAYPSACGQASSAMGPFYCPTDSKVYLDMDFFDELSQRFGAAGDFADAYVIAHEVGHHVQNLLGILPEYHRMRQKMGQDEANRLSVRVELQADCFAGIFGRAEKDKGYMDPGDLEEALKAANQIGDDALQKSTQGYAVPDSFTHGTSAQRVKWFKRGFDTGNLESCDTFSNPV
jgi:uncharacterized protein